MIARLLKCLSAFPKALEILYLRTASEQMGALHPDLPYVIHRIRDLERSK